MQSATEIGTNHSGMDISPTADEMLENTELTEPTSGDERGLAKLRGEYVSQAGPVGTLPQAVQPEIFFAGAVTKSAREPDAATALLRFLTGPEAEPVIKKAGLTPLSER